jgi:hypothetical protein
MNPAIHITVVTPDSSRSIEVAEWGDASRVIRSHLDPANSRIPLIGTNYPTHAIVVRGPKELIPVSMRWLANKARDGWLELIFGNVALLSKFSSELPTAPFSTWGQEYAAAKA